MIPVLKGVIIFLILLVAVILVLPKKGPSAPVSQALPATQGPTRTPRPLPTFTSTPTPVYIVMSSGITVTVTPGPTDTPAPIIVVGEAGSEGPGNNDGPVVIETTSFPNSEPILQVSNPLDYINNPGRFRNKLVRITMFVSKIVLTPVEGGDKAMVLSLVANTDRSGTRYRPVIVFGLLDDPVNRVREGDQLSIDGIGSGSLNKSQLDKIVSSEAILPKSMVNSNDDWSVPVIRGVSYYIIQGN